MLMKLYVGTSKHMHATHHIDFSSCNSLGLSYQTECIADALMLLHTYLAPWRLAH